MWYFLFGPVLYSPKTREVKLSKKHVLDKIPDVFLCCIGYMKFVLVHISSGGKKKHILWAGSFDSKYSELYEEFLSENSVEKRGIKCECVGGNIMEYSPDSPDRISVLGSSNRYGKASRKVVKSLLSEELPGVEVRFRGR